MSGFCWALANNNNWIWTVLSFARWQSLENEWLKKQPGAKCGICSSSKCQVNLRLISCSHCISRVRGFLLKCGEWTDLTTHCLNANIGKCCILNKNHHRNNGLFAAALQLLHCAHVYFMCYRDFNQYHKFEHNWFTYMQSLNSFVTHAISTQTYLKYLYFTCIY